jgi:hypothetical protein
MCVSFECGFARYDATERIENKKNRKWKQKKKKKQKGAGRRKETSQRGAAARFHIKGGRLLLVSP